MWPGCAHTSPVFIQLVNNPPPPPRLTDHSQSHYCAGLPTSIRTRVCIIAHKGVWSIVRSLGKTNTLLNKKNWFGGKMETSCFNLKKGTPALTLILENTIFYILFCWLYVLILAYQEVVLGITTLTKILALTLILSNLETILLLLYL